jgi:hypothetical protein
MRTVEDRHIVWIAAGFVLLMGIAFTPSYFKPIVEGSFNAPPIFHIHGALFFAWPILFLVQAMVIARGKHEVHRSLGLFGIALATAMFFTGIAAVAHDLRIDQDGLALVAFAGLMMFSLYVILALVYRKRRDYHYRWMFLATLAIMQAVSARFVARVLLDMTPPDDVPQVTLVQRAGMIHLLFDILVLAIVCIVDWRRRGRPHPVFVFGGALLLIMHAFRHLAMETTAWRATAELILAMTQ